MTLGEATVRVVEKTEKDTNRLEAFSDGVFAIAITLLVLDLHVPPVTSIIHAASPGKALAGALLDSWPSYLSFILSFVTILIMWIYHHRLFQAVRRAETVLLFSNGLLLLLVTVVPFPTALVSAYLTTSAASVACATYAGFFACINLAYNLLWWVVTRQQPDMRVRKYFQGSMLISLLGFPSYLLALVVAFWLPWLCLSICSALWIAWVITAPKPLPEIV
jgi:uncharacterized membrane protein